MKKFSGEWWRTLPPEKVGKETELLVEKLFKDWNHRQSFAWHRLPDARSARGALKAQPSDYIYRSGMYAGMIEVKALKHPFRLPADRLTQLPTLLKWTLAGSNDLILVFHYLEGVWRLVFADDLPTDATSWDLSNFPQYASAEAALKSTGWFE